MICIPITDESMRGALADIREAGKIADVLELRLDYIKGLNEKALKELVSASEKKVIATVRRENEGGKFKGTESKRVELLKKAIKAGVHFVDIEFEMNSKQRAALLKYAKTQHVKVILSHHDFKGTPFFEELLELFEKMSKVKGVYALKIATYARTHEDNSLIFRLLRVARKKNRRLISFSMGALGRDSRILSLPLGSYLTFGSLASGKESAEGQIEAKELKKIYSGLKVMI